MQGNKGDPGEQSQIKLGEAQRQQQPARAGKEYLARTNSIHRFVP